MDDDEYDFVLTQRLLGKLEGRDYELDWASSYEEGLDALEPGRYDAALIDYQLGPRSGLDLLREAASRGIGTPMIVMTAHGDVATDQRAQGLGAAGYLEKGKVDAQAIDRAVRYAVSREGMVADLIEQNTELLRLHRLTTLLLEPGPPHEQLAAAAGEVAAATGFPLVAIEAYDARRRTLRDLATHGLPDAERHPQERPVEDTLAGRVVLEQRPRMEADLGIDPLPDVQDQRWSWVGTWLCLPVWGDGQVLGALTLAHPDPVPIDSAQVASSSALAEHLGRLIGRLVEREAQTTPDEAPAEDLTEDLEAILTWYGEEAERRGLTVEQESVVATHRSLRGDRARMGHVLPLYLSAALRHAERGVLRIQTFPEQADEQILVSFPLAGAPEARQTGLETCERVADQLGGSLSSWEEPGGEFRVGLGIGL